MTLKLIEELHLMPMKNDGKVEEELSYRFKIDMKNLTNVDTST